MQQKIIPPSSGDSPLYRKEAIDFVRKWPSPLRVRPRWIFFFIYLARNPQMTTNHFSQWKQQPKIADQLHNHFGSDFLNKYAAAPDLAAALLHFLRKKFARLEKTPTGRLKIYIATTIAHKWHKGFGVKPDDGGHVWLHDLQDGELATAFEKSPGGGVVSVNDVVKARKWVAKNQIAWKQTEPRLVDKDGYVCSKGWLRQKA